MRFIDLAKKRYSVRNYKKTAVEKEKLDIILESAHVSPTAANCEPNHFLVINNESGLKKLSTATDTHGGTLAIIVCGDKKTAWVRPYDNHSMVDIDATIATDHMMMCAESLDLSTCWITYFNPEILTKAFNIPSNLIPVNILVIGYSADKEPLSGERHSETRKAMSKMVTYDSF